MGVDKHLSVSRWAEHFEEVFSNTLAPANTPDNSVANDNLPIDCGTPTKAEISKAIKQLKNGKAAGAHEVPAKKKTQSRPTHSSREMVYGLFEKIWEEKEIPSERNPKGRNVS